MAVDVHAVIRHRSGCLSTKARALRGSRRAAGAGPRAGEGCRRAGSGVPRTPTSRKLSASAAMVRGAPTSLDQSAGDGRTADHRDRLGGLELGVALADVVRLDDVGQVALVGDVEEHRADADHQGDDEQLREGQHVEHPGQRQRGQGDARGRRRWRSAPTACATGRPRRRPAARSTRKARNSQNPSRPIWNSLASSCSHREDRQREHGQLGAELAQRVADEQLPEVVVVEAGRPGVVPGGWGSGSAGSAGRPGGHSAAGAAQRTRGPSSLTDWELSISDATGYRHRHGHGGGGAGRPARAAAVRPAAGRLRPPGRGPDDPLTRPRPRRSRRPCGCGSCASRCTSPAPTRRSRRRWAATRPRCSTTCARWWTRASWSSSRAGVASAARASCPTSRRARASTWTSARRPRGEQDLLLTTFLEEVREPAPGRARQRPARFPAQGRRPRAGARTGSTTC